MIVRVVAKTWLECPNCTWRPGPTDVRDIERRAANGMSQTSHESFTEPRRRCFGLPRNIDLINASCVSDLLASVAQFGRAPLS